MSRVIVCEQEDSLFKKVRLELNRRGEIFAANLVKLALQDGHPVDALNQIAKALSLPLPEGWNAEAKQQEQTK